MNIKRRQIEKELFDMAYQWGRQYLITDELCNAFQDKLEEYKIIIKSNND